MIAKNIQVTICKPIGPNRLLRDTSFHNIGLYVIIMNAAFTNKKHRVLVTLYNKLIVFTIIIYL